MSKLIVSEEFLQQVETLQTVLRNNVAGMFGGNRKSKTYGSSCEFADYRDYQPGVTPEARIAPEVTAEEVV